MRPGWLVIRVVCDGVQDDLVLREAGPTDLVVSAALVRPGVAQWHPDGLAERQMQESRAPALLAATQSPPTRGVG
ncbi:MAG: hypothetical protein ACKOWF_01650 [Chloroflexota bacterium]